MPKKKSLVIVESPAKAKTISRFLGDEYIVLSSYGHIRDLPTKEMGIDMENDFEPKYVIPPKAKKNVAEIKKQAKKTKTIYFAPDADREGEAIAWHLQYILDGDDDGKHNNSFEFKRIVFHEITEHAIKEALKHPKEIDQHLVDAQQARRILDRLVGYELSPFLWKKVAKGLSAGRVQSAAVRLIVERENEIKKFKPEEYWSVEAELNPEKKPKDSFISKLYKIDDKVMDKFHIKNEKKAKEIEKEVKKGNFVIEKVEKKKSSKNPLAPFTTSTMQQEAVKKLGFSAKQTMMIAQQLYEGIELGGKEQIGLITYMRTDSVNLSDKFIGEAKEYIKSTFGDKYLPAKDNVYKTKSKLAQEAHEAVRPTHASFSPENIKKDLNSNQFKLYQLIWQRAMACQMSSASFDATTVDIKNQQYLFRATGSILIFDGFLKVYSSLSKDSLLPDLKEKQKLNLKKLEPLQHFTEPPARYTDATLVKAMEELGIGRPSTYSPTISTIINRGYVKRDGKKFAPQDIAFVVTKLLVKHFPEIADYKFTAKMEDQFDEIAQGKLEWQPLIKEFYMPFKENLKTKEKEINKEDLIDEKTDEVCDKCGEPMAVKIGRYGKFLACSGFPKCRNIKNLPKDEKELKEEAEELNPEGEKCPECKKELVVKQSRFGKFLACSGYPDCKYIKNNFSTGVNCPQCEKGKIMMRKTRSKRVFYGCSEYPNCNFALWQKPVQDEKNKGKGRECPKCKALLVEAGENKIKCSAKECKYTEEVK